VAVKKTGCLEDPDRWLHDLAGKGLEDLVTPVLAALEGIEPTITLPWVALSALDVLRGTASQRGDQ
jgi:hypothetical protein